MVSHTDHVPLEAMNIELSRQESVSRLNRCKMSFPEWLHPILLPMGVRP